jgi:hypothetical protein
MAFRVSIAELGIVNDDAVIEAATPGDVWRQVSKRLKDKHNIKLPALEDLGGEAALFPVLSRFDNAAVAGQQGPVIATAAGRFNDLDNGEVRVIATRLLEKLRAGQQGSASSDIVPPGGTQSPMP